MNKFLQFPFVRILIAILFLWSGVIVGQILLNFLRSVLSITNTAIANMVAFALITPIILTAYALYVRWIEKRQVTELGFKNAEQEFGLGALIGLGLLTVIIMVLWLLGVYHVTGIEFAGLALLGILLGALVSALVQELIFRAVIYRITEEWLGPWWALAISALLFGLLHLSSAGATVFSALAIALQAGIVLAAAYALTHRLWMALGIHLAWDFANDGIFGVGIAGQTGESIKGVLQANLSGPQWLTGGSLGVEASVVALVVMLLAGAALLWSVFRGSALKTREVESAILLPK